MLQFYVYFLNIFLADCDSSPPFDITLDIVTDHKGNAERPIYLAKGTYNKWIPEVEKLELHLGQSGLFLGSQMLHYGGYLEKGSYHNVTLFTYQFVVD